MFDNSSEGMRAILFANGGAWIGGYRLEFDVCKSCDEYGKPGNFGVVGESFGRIRQLYSLISYNGIQIH